MTSAEETIPIANPRSVNRVGDAVLHYKPAGGTMPLPINVILSLFWARAWMNPL